MATKNKKSKPQFICTECGYITSKWMGNCPECNKWNTFVEEAYQPATFYKTSSKKQTSVPVSLTEVEIKTESRIQTEFNEFDRTLGGGIVVGSLILLSGDPGIGKSTILLQVCSRFKQKHKVLYVSGEESVQQIKSRSQRLGLSEENIFLLDETNLEAVESSISKIKPSIIVIDSIQTIYRMDIHGIPGSISQIREGANILLQIAKKNEITIFLIGHVTKEGVIAGPKLLEHIVDTVLYLEGDKESSYRILRTFKNRYGSTDELGVFEMKKNGFEEVDNPSKIFFEDTNQNMSGSVVSCIFEGNRSILVEVQALVSSSHFTMPRRTVDGIDTNKVLKIIAVIEKKLELSLINKDIYINIVGGMKIKEPAVDLAVLTAIYSSLKNLTPKRKSVFIGEVGLSGEVRGVKNIVQRINEAQKFNFDLIFVPAKNVSEIRDSGYDNVEGISNIKEAVNKLLD